MINKNIMNSLEKEFCSLEGIDSAGLFGSTVRGKSWEHSDIDFFLVFKRDKNYSEAFTFKCQGLKIHVQAFSKKSFLLATEKNTGSPLFQALSEVELWFDHSSLLSRSIALGKGFGLEA